MNSADTCDMTIGVDANALMHKIYNKKHGSSLKFVLMVQGDAEHGKTTLQAHVQFNLRKREKGEEEA